MADPFRGLAVEALRRLLLRAGADASGCYDYDVEGVLEKAEALGLDVEKLKEWAKDYDEMPAKEFEAKWPDDCEDLHIGDPECGNCGRFASEHDGCDSIPQVCPDFAPKRRS